MTIIDYFSIVIPALNEEEHIENLIRSIHQQNYRPIEVIVVDDGSSDETISIVAKLAILLNSSSFNICCFQTKQFGELRGPAIAREIGIKNSVGKYILLVDSDCLLSQRSILEELAIALKSSSMAGYLDVVLLDTWLEYNLMLDEGNPPYSTNAKWSHLAFRREILEKVRFDSQLGVGEDVDFLKRVNCEGYLNPNIIRSSGHIHLVHTFNEYKIQRIWMGRTRWLFLRKHLNFFNFLSLLAGAMSISTLFLSSILMLVDFWIGFMVLIFWAVLVIYLFMLSPVKSPARIVFLLFRLVYGSFWYSFGLLKGFYDLYIRGAVNPSREK